MEAQPDAVAGGMPCRLDFKGLVPLLLKLS